MTGQSKPETYVLVRWRDENFLYDFFNLLNNTKTVVKFFFQNITYVYLHVKYQRLTLAGGGKAVVNFDIAAAPCL